MVHHRVGSAVVLAVILSMLFSCESNTEEAELLVPENELIEVSLLNAWLNNPSRLVIVDVRKPEEFNEGHLPGAVNIWRSDIEDTSVRYNGKMATQEQMEALLSNRGIDSSTFVVMYDAKGQVDAARLWWLLSYYGHEKKALLNGGLQAWQAQGARLSSEDSHYTPTAYEFAGNIHPEILATMQDIKQKSVNTILIDSRCEAEYKGEVKKNGAFQAGAIAGSVLLDYYDNCYNEGSKSTFFKTKTELQKRYEDAGIYPTDTVIVYCHSGVRSAQTTFVLRNLLGYKNVKNYDGSWVEWSYYQNLDSIQKLNGIN